MRIMMNDSRLTNINQLRSFLKGSQGVDLSLRGVSIDEKYTFIGKIVKQFRYNLLRKKDKRIVKQYLKKVTGYKHSQLGELIKRAGRGQLTRQPYHRIKPHRIYTSTEIKLLEKTDELHLRLSEKATKEILRREREVFDHQNYQTIAKISHAHITNLRHHSVYKSHWLNHTKARIIPIGVTMAPENHGKPGSIKVDTVHQRDIYHINSVDEITQWEVVVCVAQICEDCMLPALQNMLHQYPFIIFNFHSDRGGENINYKVADLLQRLVIKQTKSRPRKPNDNALVETKNGAVIRKNMGWEHIHQNMVDKINKYYQNFFNPYLNYHRPCGYPTTITDKKGKKKKRYDSYQVPYEYLKSLKNARQYLKPGISFDKLDKIAYRQSDNEFAAILRKEERILFNKIRKYDHRVSLRTR
jgi:hypothetical protein